jgi:hypothetical protein
MADGSTDEIVELTDLAARLDRIEAEVFCKVRVSDMEPTLGDVYETGCGEDVGYEDWSDRERCPKCGKRLMGHDAKASE